MAWQIYVTSIRRGKNAGGALCGIVEVVERELSRGGLDVIRKEAKGHGKGELWVNFDFERGKEKAFRCRIFSGDRNMQRLYKCLSTRLADLARLSGGRAEYIVSREKENLLIEAKWNSEPSLAGLLLVLTGMELAGCILAHLGQKEGESRK